MVRIFSGSRFTSVKPFIKSWQPLFLEVRPFPLQRRQRAKMVGYSFHYKNKVGEEMKMTADRNSAKSGWVELFLKRKFFGICKFHNELRKCEKNVYCIDCNHSMCQHCLSSESEHKCHRLIQIRRYVYQDVVRVHDMQKLVNLSKIQTFTVNGAKVVLLNSKKQARPSKVPPGTSLCKICSRTLSEPHNLFCSIACKINEESVEAPVDESGPFISPPTPDLEDLSPKEGQSCSSLSSHPSISSDEDAGRWMNDSDLAPAAPVRKINRRKGMPKRSPFF